VPDGGDGILLDITGCAHLQGGEARLIAEIAGRISRAGFACRAAIADTAGAAWAVARYGQAAALCIAPGAAREALADLPVAALRLAVSSVADLERLGLARIGDLYRLPRAALAQRFGDALAGRLDQALGQAGEPLSPLRARPARRSRLAFAEPDRDAGGSRASARPADRRALPRPRGGSRRRPPASSSPATALMARSSGRLSARRAPAANRAT